MNNQQLVAFLKKNLACRPALEWLQARTLAEAWEQSERGDWMLWLAAKAGVDRRRLVMAACACARLALVHVPPGEERPRVAIETAEAWCRGEATIEQVRNAAADAAYAYAADAERMNQSRLLSLAVVLSEWSPQWHSSTTVDLAQAIYCELAYDRIPILADALEDSGCDHPWLLTAMRDERMQSWYRGMWFLDKLRGVE